ncbi:hypothetical protein BKA82DRAFT_4143423 [Pisolithus tinctorius]|nr:hypothetical protein BKA82DRAFT_4143423 [Pisolithus tinctorius]
MVTVVAIAIVVVIFLLILWRFYILRRINRSSPSLIPPLRNSGSQSWERTRGSSYQPYRVPMVPPIDDAHHPNRQVRAADTDAGGRRLSSLGASGPDRKDELPAYDKSGGPPRYLQSLYQGSQELPYNMPPLHTVTEGGADNSQNRGMLACFLLR